GVGSVDGGRVHLDQHLAFSRDRTLNLCHLQHVRRSIAIGRDCSHLAASMLGDMTALSDQLKRVPSKTRPTVVAAIKSVKEIAPKATEVPYKSEPPRSPSAMW